MPIKRHEALQPLSRDHHQGLILAQLIKRNAPEYKGLPKTTNGKKEYTISFFENELKQHFLDEEKILFPTASNKNNELDKLIEELLIEHREINNLIEKIASSLQPENLLDELGRKLEVHIRKEEREVFVKIEEALSEKELIELGSKLIDNPAKC
jgi:iron-sulfur cluster repair protein YtfE (RIC family)